MGGGACAFPNIYTKLEIYKHYVVWLSKPGGACEIKHGSSGHRRAAATRQETSHPPGDHCRARNRGKLQDVPGSETKHVLSLLVLERVKNEISVVEVLKDAFEQKHSSLNDGWHQSGAHGQQYAGIVSSCFQQGGHCCSAHADSDYSVPTCVPG